jgi:hypothetical protein
MPVHGFGEDGRRFKAPDATNARLQAIVAAGLVHVPPRGAVCRAHDGGDEPAS